VIARAPFTGGTELPELVIIGAKEKLARVRAERSRTAGLRRSLADRVRAGALPVDAEAAEAVRRSGWPRE
jgi:hypothetical protein